MAMSRGTTAWQATVGPAWVEVDLDAIFDNARAVLNLLPGSCRLMGVVKADGYGHDAFEVSRVLVEAGAAVLGLSTVAEALALRGRGVRVPILVFTPARPVDLPAAVAADLTLTVASLDGAGALADAARRVGRHAVAHVELDCGMGRYGFDAAHLDAQAAQLAHLARYIQWEGAFTHFPRGAEPGPSRLHLNRFLTMVSTADRSGLHVQMRHAAASAAMLSLPESRLDMVRIGTLLYGERPAGLALPVGMRPAFRLRVEPAQLRDVPRGTRVGYGGEWTAPAPTRIAVLPVGHAEGLDIVPAGPYRRPAVLLRALVRWLLSCLRIGSVLGPRRGDIEFSGHPAPVVGRIGMQQVTVDCTNVPQEALRQPATVHVPAGAVGAHLARVFIRDGVPVRMCVAARARLVFDSTSAEGSD